MRSVGYVFSKDATIAASRLPSNVGRSRMVHSLVLDGFGLGGQMRILEPKPVSREDLVQFHSEEFVDALLTAELNLDTELSKEQLETLQDFGLVHDCPVFPGLSDYVKYVAGGTITAAKALASNQCNVAIHWDGGRHHAHQDSASGFCYVNDIVLGIMELHNAGLKRVLYIDLDIHHCDGVESAFEFSKKVFRLSFHVHEPGFFPGTGDASETGSGNGTTCALNVPLPPLVTDSVQFLAVFKFHLSKVLETMYPSPNAIVMQCGLDGCKGDPLVPHGWKLDSFAIGDCVAELLEMIDERTPVLLLGGGGYRNEMAARGWAYATMKALGLEEKDMKELEIPEHEYFECYGPDFLLYSD
ncbi:Arginase/deacetylase [Rhizoclosmatium globosum]|uniref:Histone deacetylase 8 n=1 Tax=Rhizoclosmatium globosum TaxID=329046 RepID=A0A1Y2C5B5_9FUNG|nr:Arginase/deacetylase [Rhizoclosmatium globosum]|eukprot:ORY42223.1 Arginase/deacetylase [Rhizoclosmatium globosum]